jgi:hypothetical protein
MRILYSRAGALRDKCSKQGRAAEVLFALRRRVRCIPMHGMFNATIDVKRPSLVGDGL